MKLNKKDIQHIADLARIELTDEELKIYGKQLSDILGYMGQLQEVDTGGVEPTAQVTGLENIFREDVIEEWNEQERKNALNQAPDMEGRQVKVKRILA